MSSEPGDLSGFLEEGSEYPLLSKEANLDWLSVSEKDYRTMEVLPQQNFQVMPELEKAWAEGRSSTLVPVKDYRPAAIMTAPVVIRPEVVAKTARFALMGGQSVPQTLLKTYDKTSIRQARDAIAEVVAEKGLLGPLYVIASDFEIVPGKYDLNLIREYASGAKYVLGKVACGCGCGGQCNPFKKPEIQDLSEVFTPQVASLVEVEQAASGKQVVASASLSPRDRIRNAYLAQDRVIQDLTPKPVLNPAQFLRTAKETKVHLPVIAQERSRIASLVKEGSLLPPDAVAFEVGEFLKREILKGGSHAQVLTQLKVAFSKQVLRETRPYWEGLYREAGILGTVYSFQEAFDSCSEGADFLDRHNSPVAVIVSGSKCAGCPSNRLGECSEYNRPLVASVEETLTPQAVAKVARSKFASIPAGEDIRSQLRALYLGEEKVRALQASHPKEYVAPRKASTKLFKEALVLTAQEHIRSGIRGRKLLATLQQKFGAALISDSVNELREVIAAAPPVLELNPVAPDVGRQMMAEFDMAPQTLDFDFEEKTPLPAIEIDLERK